MKTFLSLCVKSRKQQEKGIVNREQVDTPSMREIYACAPKSQSIRLNVHRVVFVHPVPPEYNTVRFVAKEQQRLCKNKSPKMQRI
jgi:hypothetical protein